MYRDVLYIGFAGAKTDDVQGCTVTILDTYMDIGDRV